MAAASSIKALLDPALTASWEKGLTLVADGDITSETAISMLNSSHSSLALPFRLSVPMPAEGIYLPFVWAKSAKVAPTACLNGPLIVDEDAEIRHWTTVPGFRTLLQPTSTLSPSMAPIFFRPVSTETPSPFTTTRVLSLFTLEVMEPAPIWALKPRMLTYPWEALPKIHDFIIDLGESLPKDIYVDLRERLPWIGQSFQQSGCDCLL